jgi:hypothetical protein
MINVPGAFINEEEVSPDRIDTGLMPRKDSLMEDTEHMKDQELNDF